MQLVQTKDIGYGSFIVLDNDLIGNNILRRGSWEEHLYRIYSKFIKPDDIIIDAGANIGFHTVQFARLSNLVYAFEPQSLIFNILSTNILFNGLSDRVKHYRLGLYNDNIKMNMQSVEQHTDDNGYINFGGRGVTEDIIDSECIDLIKWDDTFSHIEKINFIKMDIQGSELSALKGMSNMLKKCMPWMLLENYDHDGDRPVVDYLLKIGYTIYRPMNLLPNEDCICLNINDKLHNDIKMFIKNSEINWKIYN